MRRDLVVGFLVALFAAPGHAQSGGVDPLPTIDELIPGRAGAADPAPVTPALERQAEVGSALPIIPRGNASVGLDPWLVRQQLVRSLIVAWLISYDFRDDWTEDEWLGLLAERGEINWGELPRGLLLVNEEVAGLVELDRVISAHLREHPPTPVPSVSDEVYAAQVQLLSARVAHDIDMLGERAHVIKTTNIIGWIICGVAHIMLLIGVWAAVLEFLHAAHTRKRAPDPLAPSAEGESPGLAEDGPGVRSAEQLQAENEIRISLEGIALRTSLHGVLLLSFAIGFYFLYLRFVYPITVIGE